MGVILAPAGASGVAEQLIASGAREVYLGFHDKAWSERFGASADINRLSGFGSEANALSFEELLGEIVLIRARERERQRKQAEQKGERHGALLDGAPDPASSKPQAESFDSASSPAPLASQEEGLVREPDEPTDEPLAVWCTFNSAQYTREQCAWIASNYLPALAGAGATGIIVSGSQLVVAALTCGLRVTASTMCAVYNEDIARVCRDVGMSRVILPRDMNLEEIEAVVAAVPDLEYEAFLMRNGCIFADSHCLGLHRAQKPSLCRTLRSSSWWEMPLSCDDARLDERVENGRVYKERFHEYACGQCVLWRLERAGIDAYKVVGRCDDAASLCADVALTARNLDIARACATEQDYLDAMERPEGIRELCADEGLSCYYPEPRFG